MFEIPASIGDDMYKLMERLFPINRSLTGNGVRQTLSILKESIPLQIHEIKTGEKVFDWEIPNEWNIKDAFIEDSSGHKIIKFSDSNLHVLGYSIPVDKTVDLAELNEHLYSIPEQPDAIPYVTSYYKERWGFCITDNQRKQLKPGSYRVKIDATLEPGSMTYADLIIPGKSSKEILISAYTCHPSMANNELAGPVLATHIASILKQRGDNLHYTYRFVFAPETIGAIAYIHRHFSELKQNVIGGYVMSCAGDAGAFSYLLTPSGNEIVDQVTLHVLKHTEKNYRVFDFNERGSNERQFNWPGVDLKVGSLMRSRYLDYPEYHTSLDNMSLITPKSLLQTLTKYLDCIQAFEMNRIYKPTTLCEPQLGKRGLYPSLSTVDSINHVMTMMNVMTYMDGKTDLLSISNRANVCILKLQDLIASLVQHQVIERMDDGL